MINRIQRTTALLLAALFALFLIPLRPASSAESSCEEILKEMSIEDKICQMLVVSFGYSADAHGNQSLTRSAAQALQEYCFGGIILYQQNITDNADTVRYIDAIQRANQDGGVGRPQLLVCTDQEGGMITRLCHGTQTPGNMALGAIADKSAAYTAGTIIGSELSALGISVDFAPVVDINSNPENPVIGIRSFSDDAGIVSECGAQYVNGLMSTGTIATLKHFPGHGDTSTDSHSSLPMIEKSYDELKQQELIPFQRCIEAGAEIIMTAHIQFPQIESTTYISKKTGKRVYLPATLSKTIITDILRGDMGFSGVVITDGMLMNALKEHFDIYDTARLAIEAGVDMLLVPVDATGSEGIQKLKSYIKELVSMVDNGEISIEKIDAAVLRILKLKHKHGLTEPYDSSDLEERIEYALQTVGSAEHHAIEWQLAKQAITVVKNDGDLLPLRNNGIKTVILTADSGEEHSMRYAVDLLQSEGKLPDGAEFEFYTYEHNNLKELKKRVKRADVVIAVSEVQRISQLRGETAQDFDSLIESAHEKGGAFILLSAYLPYDAARFQKSDAIVLAYSSKGMNEDPRVYEGASLQYGPNLPAAIYCMFSADDIPLGRLPVRIPKLGIDGRFLDETLYERGFSIFDAPEPSNTPTPWPTSAPTQSPVIEPTSEPVNTFRTAAPTPAAVPENSQAVDLNTDELGNLAKAAPRIELWTIILLFAGFALIFISAIMLIKRKN